MTLQDSSSSQMDGLPEGFRPNVRTADTGGGEISLKNMIHELEAARQQQQKGGVSGGI